MTLKEYSEQAHKSAMEKGFYEDTKVIEYLMNELSKIEFDWLKNNAIATRLMLVSSELGESVEALRNNNLGIFNNVISEFNSMDNEQFKIVFESTIKDTFTDEIADVFIRLFDLCGFMKIDIEQSIKLKMRYNSLRENKHGKEF